MKVDYRVAETPDGRLVPEDQAFEGGVLYARAGDELSEEDWERLEGVEEEQEEESSEDAVLSDLTVDELQDLARELDVSYSGLRKDELIAAIEEAQAEAGDDDEAEGTASTSEEPD